MLIHEIHVYLNCGWKHFFFYMYNPPRFKLYLNVTWTLTSAMPVQRLTVEFSGQLGDQVIVWVKKKKKILQGSYNKKRRQLFKPPVVIAH